MASHDGNEIAGHSVVEMLDKLLFASGMVRWSGDSALPGCDTHSEFDRRCNSSRSMELAEGEVAWYGNGEDDGKDGSLLKENVEVQFTYESDGDGDISCIQEYGGRVPGLLAGNPHMAELPCFIQRQCIWRWSAVG